MLPYNTFIRHALAALAFVLSSALFTASASAAPGTYQEDCAQGPTREFTSPADEVAYFNRFHNCYAERLSLNGTTPQKSFMGKGLELLSHPEYIEAIAFSKYMCTADYVNAGNNYPCWFETNSISTNTTMEEAAKAEAPKMLLSKLSHTHNGDVVEYVICLNDDPTKPKEYTRSCTRGYKMEFLEYAHSDVNRDGIEDIVVRIRFGINHNDFKRCYIAAFTRKNGELVKMIYYSPTGQCT